MSTLNGGSTPFNFSKDVVLKSGLTLIDAREIGFKVSNFTQQNMSLLEKKWGEVRSALIVARDLLESFGFSERTLSAESVIVPLAYYACSRGLGSSYVTSSAQAADRQAMRSWVMRSQMKRGIWGSGLDTLLGRLREAIRNHGTIAFPVDEIEAAMAAMGKSLKFDDAEIAELCELAYGRPRTFSTLAMLYPGLDLTKQFHEDHIFARSRFTRARLARARIPQESIDDYLERVDHLPNLQLLAGVPNTEKQAHLPLEWLHGPHFTNAETRETYMRENDLDGVPLEFERFLDFYDARRQRIEQRLGTLLGTQPGAAVATQDAEA